MDVWARALELYDRSREHDEVRNEALIVGALFALPVLLGCAVDPVNLMDRSCPCSHGWRCVDQVCVPDTSTAECGGGGAYEVRDFAAGWRTENALHWTWGTAPDVDGRDLTHLTVVLGEDAAEVERCACALGAGGTCDENEALRVIDETVNPELAYDTRSNLTDGPEPVRSTVTSGLRHDTVYAATLLAFDTRDAVSRTEMAFNRTGRRAERSVSVFDRGRVGRGYSIPTCAELDEQGYSYTVMCPPPTAERGGCKVDEDPCPAGREWPGSRSDDWLCETDEHPAHAPVCWVTMRWQELDLPLATLPAGAFADAYIEFVMTMDGQPSNYGVVYLVLTDAEGTATTWGLRGELALRSGEMATVYQVPLRALTLEDGSGMEWSDIEGERLYRVSVGGIFAHGQTVRFETIGIRF